MDQPDHGPELWRHLLFYGFVIGIVAIFFLVIGL